MNAVGLFNRRSCQELLLGGPPGQRRHKSHLNSVSILQQFYNRLPIRKRYIKAIKKGTLVWDKGQVKIPPLKIEGYDPPKKCLSPLVKNRNNQYRGSFLNLRAHRVEFQD